MEKNSDILCLKIGNTNKKYGIPEEELQWDI